MVCSYSFRLLIFIKVYFLVLMRQVCFVMLSIQTNLISLVKLQPSVLHLGHKGAMLLARFLSVPQGFKYLTDSGHLTTELDKWHRVRAHDTLHIIKLTRYL